MRDSWTSSQIVAWARLSHRDRQSKLAAMAPGIQSANIEPSKASRSALDARGIAPLRSTPNGRRFTPGD
jgi:hypothetical protein